MRASLSCNARPRMWEPGALLDRQDEETKTPMSCNAWPITWECLASLSERLNESITLSRNAQPRVWGLEAEGFRLLSTILPSPYIQVPCAKCKTNVKN
eukprot:1153219-Pelagomonas_calceolata.AAC.4